MEPSSSVARRSAAPGGPVAPGGPGGPGGPGAVGGPGALGGPGGLGGLGGDPTGGLGGDLAGGDRPDCAASRIALVTAHADRVLKITHPYVSDSGRWEATWTGGGSAIADTENELLQDIAALLGHP